MSNQGRVRSLILVRRRMAVKPQQHQHEQQAIVARSELVLSSFVREQLPNRRIAEDLERDSRAGAD